MWPVRLSGKPVLSWSLAGRLCVEEDPRVNIWGREGEDAGIGTGRSVFDTALTAGLADPTGNSR